MSIVDKQTPAESKSALEISESFRVFVEAVQDYAIFMLDCDGYVQTWNIGAQRIKGYQGSEIIGQHFSKFYPEQDVQNGKPGWELEVAAREGRFEDEGWRIRKDGSKFWANVIITAVRDQSGKLIGFGKVTRDFSERKATQEALRQTNAELAREISERKSTERRLAESERSLRDLSLHLLRSQDEERRRIGRDLHDSLGQYLAVLKIHLDSLVSMIDADGTEVSTQLARCIHLAEDSITELRTISYLLYPPLLEEMGLKAAIPWYLEGFTKRSSVHTTFEVATQIDRVDRDIELALFRVLQESLTNVHRHSRSESARVRLLSENSVLILEVQDHGRGLSPEFLDKVGDEWLGSFGVGLRGMNERMRQLGGSLQIRSSAQGTTITASVPVEEKSVAAAPAFEEAQKRTA